MEPFASWGIFLGLIVAAIFFVALGRMRTGQSPNEKQYIFLVKATIIAIIFIEVLTSFLVVLIFEANDEYFAFLTSPESNGLYDRLVPLLYFYVALFTFLVVVSPVLAFRRLLGTDPGSHWYWMLIPCTAMSFLLSLILGLLWGGL